MKYKLTQKRLLFGIVGAIIAWSLPLVLEYVGQPILSGKYFNFFYATIWQVWFTLEPNTYAYNILILPIGFLVGLLIEKNWRKIK